jgi:hypothetical protein
MSELIDFVDPISGSKVGAMSSSMVTFPSGAVVYGSTCQHRPKRLRKTEKLAGWHLKEASDG